MSDLREWRLFRTLLLLLLIEFTEATSELFLRAALANKLPYGIAEEVVERRL